MSNNLGSGVSRVLDPANSGFTEVVWQQGKPPCDAELNLSQEIATDFTRKAVMRGTPSGWLGNETNGIEDYVTNTLWSNWFKFGRQRTGEQKSTQWAAVNGWLVPVMGTKTGTPPGSPNDTDVWNLVALDPPPANSGDFRVDFVFLEVWLARTPPNPDTTNKPSASAIYKYGNVEGGASFIADDMVDPALGFETTQRVQLQYRIRVVKGLVGLASYPDGFDPAVVKAQGANSATTSYTFANMRQELGDPGLWRAGDGTANALGTVDGYTYAIPICTVFRRNSVAWTGDPSPNLNGGFNRNPTAVDRTGYKTFSVTGSISDTTPSIPLLTAHLSATATSFSVSPTTYLPLPSAPATPVLIQVGDEMMTYSGISAGVVTVTRGVNGTRAETHALGTPVVVLSGRPDGLFSDQVAMTDILDLRHVVSPNGFDYDAVLKQGLDKLLKGTLRANWKRTGAGPQGTFLPYEDKIGTSAAMGITKLDAPDSIRLAYSDAAMLQQVEFIALANGDLTPAEISETWSLTHSIKHTTRGSNGEFNAGDVLSIPIISFKTGLPGGDTDQVRFVNDGFSSVAIRIEGETTPLDPSTYAVTPTNPGPTSDLVITLGAGFPQVVAPKHLYITVTVMYGPGRGLARRPDAIHKVSFIDVGSDVLTHHAGIDEHFPLKVGWLPLWSKFRTAMFKGLLPVTAEAYADLGSKSVVLQPFRKITWPSLTTMDGTAANLRTSPFISVIAGGTVSGTATLVDSTKNFGTLGVIAGDALVITVGNQPGRYTVLFLSTTTNPNDTINVERDIPATIGTVNYSVYHAQGLMPLLKRDGVTPKWSITDPLDMFSGVGETEAKTKNIYVTIPRHFMPGWGAYHVSIYTAYDETQNATFAEGVNFGFISIKGPTAGITPGDKNYVPYGFSGVSYAIFSTWDFTSLIPATYNTSFGSLGYTMAGCRHFTDTRGLGRKGLELPPFYGIARLFAVYEAQDYNLNGRSAYEADSRVAKTTGSMGTNLLRQNFDGPVFWVETDSDGDSTFILNADALDLSRCPNAVSFDTGHFIIEASIFGFDRDTFDITKEPRLVLTRPGTGNRTEAASTAGARGDNLGIAISAPNMVLPGPVGAGAAICSVAIDYSRTPYQGDAFGSQMSYADLSYSAGPIQSAIAYQIVSTDLDSESLTRPNQKLLEVLSSCGFSTTLGTGRISGDPANYDEVDFRNVGYEDPTAFPPVSSIAARPVFFPGAFAGDLAYIEAGSDYLGCTERLPLGAILRDKDFRGGSWGWNLYAPFARITMEGSGLCSSLGTTVASELSEIALGTASEASGQAGEFVVHVDGETSNYSLLTNYRTFRGGSVFTANGPHPGGEVVVLYPSSAAPGGHTNILHGKAFLVRNTVTTVGATEVSAGDELMMLVVTTGQMLGDSNPHASVLGCGTNGYSEGYSAADLYRLDGRPLVRDNIRPEIDPSSISLPRK